MVGFWMIVWILVKDGEFVTRLLSNLVLIGCPPASLRKMFSFSGVVSQATYVKASSGCLLHLVTPWTKPSTPLNLCASGASGLMTGHCITPSLSCPSTSPQAFQLNTSETMLATKAA